MHNTTNNKSSPPSLTFLLMATMVGIFATNLYLPSFSNIALDLNASSQSVQLTLTVFLFSFGIFQLLHGPLSDQIGRKKVMIFGLFIFIVASFGAALANSINFLIVMRVLQAIGGSTGMVIARAMVRDVYERDESAKVMAYVGMGSGVSAAAAPLIGGLLQDLTGDWRWGFYSLAIFAVIPLIIIIFLVEETFTPLKKNENKLNSITYSFLTLLKSKKYLLYTLGSGTLNSCFFSFAAAAPFILNNLIDSSASRIGIILLYISIGFLIGNLLSTKLNKRISLEKIVLVGITICFTGIFIFFILAFLNLYNEVVISIPMTVYGFGSGLVIPTAGVIAVSVDKNIVGTGSALYGFNIFIMGAISTLFSSFIIHKNQIPVSIIMMVFVSIAVICFYFGYKNKNYN
ncbi:MAG: hypothetical protein CMM49_01380 [Rhodospirillaceae bacterium]|nr:hypothetical protein [Rhodospirillaceae bacterium]